MHRSALMPRRATGSEQRQTGNLLPDGWLAALAMELGAGFVTSDRGFARYVGLRITEPVL